MHTNILALSSTAINEILSLPELTRFFRTTAHISYVPEQAAVTTSCFLSIPFGNTDGYLLFVSDEDVCDPTRPEKTTFIVQTCSPPTQPRIACRCMGDIAVADVVDFMHILTNVLHELFHNTQFDITRMPA